MADVKVNWYPGKKKEVLEASAHTQSASTILANYGDSIETFQEDKLLKEYMPEMFGLTHYDRSGVGYDIIRSLFRIPNC